MGIDCTIRTCYNTDIINRSPHKVFLPTNQQDIVLDMAGNLRQISSWTRKGLHKSQKKNIELFLKLTRKDVDELHRFPLPKAFVPAFKKFCAVYNRLEGEYHAGVKDHKAWGLGIQSCAQEITQKSFLV